ncbi:MAG: DUF4962 domain-containing protein [Candidatus Brocadiia bacterium]
MTHPAAVLACVLGFLPLLAVAGGPPAAEALKRQLDRRPKTGEKPFAPAHHSTTAITPPAFVWLPVSKRPEHYVLAVAPSPDFPEERTLRFQAPISVHIPARPLEPGRWHWRVGVAAPDGAMAWGKARTFDVPDDAQVWPFPEMDALIAKIPERHPRLFFPGERLERARTHVRGPLGEEYQRLVRRARQWVGEELVPEPDWLKKGPERGPHCVKIMRETRPPMDKMALCALAYLLGGERELGLEAKRRLLHFFSWDPEGPTGLFSYDEPAMWVMQRGTRAYDWTYDLFTSEERARIEPVMKARSLQFLRRLRRMPYESRPYSSHPARDVGFLGEAAICFAHEWPEARQWLRYVLKLYRGVFPAWGEEDGGWQEGPGYWRAYMGFALHFVAALKHATGEDLMRKPFFQNTPYYKLYTNPPYARMAPFGDGQHGPPGRGSGHLMYAFSTLLQDPYIRWYPAAMGAGPGSGTLGFALYDPDLEPKPPTDLPQARAFPGAGLVAMHADLADTEDNVYLVMRSSPYGSISHGHADQNAFVLEGYGEALAIATGYYPWYSSPHHHNWTRETKAKNCITIDGGQGQVKRSWKAAGRIAQFLHGRHYDYALGDASAAYGRRLTKFLRHIVHVRPRVFVLVDEVEAPKPVTWEWWLHALEEMSVDPETRDVLIRRGHARLRVRFVQPRELAFSQTDQFTPPPEYSAKRRSRYPNQWHLTASTKEKARRALFFTVLRAYREGEASSLPPLEPIAADGAVGVAWQESGYAHRVLFGTEGLDCRGIATDGRLVAVRSREGEESAWLACAATRLVIDGKSVLATDRAVTTTSGARP